MEQRRTGGLHIARMRVQFHVRWLCAWLSLLSSSLSLAVCGSVVCPCAKRRRCSSSIRIPRKATAGSLSLSPSIRRSSSILEVHQKNPDAHEHAYAVITSVKHTRKYRRCATRTY